MQSIDVLVFEGCPNVDATLERVHDALEAAGQRDAVVRVIRVEDDHAAQRERFLGSPSVRVDGVDVEPAARGRTDFGLQCRVYAFDERLDGVPPLEWIRAALAGEGGPVRGQEAARARSCCGSDP